jgi:hypothetical protein
LDELVTRTYTLDQINEAYADLVAGHIIRGVVELALSKRMSSSMQVLVHVLLIVFLNAVQGL